MGRRQTTAFFGRYGNARPAEHGGLKTMAERPAIFVTRKLPEAVTARLLQSYRATLNPEDGPITGPACRRRLCAC